MTPTAHVQPEVWVRGSCQDMLSLAACCWPVVWPGPHYTPSLQQKDSFKMDQSTKNLSSLNLPKKDGSEQVSSCFINCQPRARLERKGIRQAALKKDNESETDNESEFLIRNSIFQKMVYYSPQKNFQNPLSLHTLGNCCSQSVGCSQCHRTICYLISQIPLLNTYMCVCVASLCVYFTCAHIYLFHPLCRN